jgi:ribosomal protein S18 acetylase RimI-like enzyme
MELKSLYKRFARYYRQHGLSSTTSKFFTALNRVLLKRRTFIFCVNLTESSFETETVLEPGFDILVITCTNQIPARYREELNVRYDAGILNKTINARFQKNARLWLVIFQGSLVGFNWTVRKHPTGRYFFPLPESSVFLFDQEIFAEYRGRGINPMVTSYILAHLKREGVCTVYLSVKEWNTANLRAISKTAFQNIGIAITARLFGKHIVIWSKMSS